MPAKPLKFVALADAHIGDRLESDEVTRFPERACSLLRYVVSQTNNEFKPDFFIQLGDLIEQQDQESDEEHLDSAAEILSELQCPLYHVIGNHEQANLGPKAVLSTLKLARPYYSFKAGGFHFIVLYSKVEQHGVSLDPSQLKWLDEELITAGGPVIVFTHFPLQEEEVEPGTEPCIGLSSDSRAMVRSLLVNSGNVRAVISAHLHKNDLAEAGGITYVSLQSLVQNISNTRKVPSESFAVFKLFETETIVEVFGADPAEFRF